MVMVRSLVKVGNREVKKRYIGNKLIFEDLGDKTEPLSGEEIYTDKADDSVVHVEIDGKSVQEGEPSPDRPSEIHSLNDFDVVSSVGGRNYWALIKEPWYAYLKYLGNGVFTNTTTSSSFAIFSMDKLEVPVGETYTASFEIKVSDDAIQFSRNLFYVNGASPSTRHNRPTLVKDKWVKVYATFDYMVENTESVHIYISGIPSMDSFQIRNFQLEKGTTATPYSPAIEDITENDNHPSIDKINLLLDEPLRSVGDVKDRLFRDSDGLWKVERKTKEVHMGNQYKTSHELAISETPEGMKIYSMSGYLTLRMNGYTTHINSTHFSYNPRSNRGRHAELYHVGMNGASGTLAHNLHFAVPEDDFPTLNSFNNWLVEEENSGTPVTLQIQSRPEDVHIETLDQELQDRLNNLRSFQDSNYVYTVVDKTDNLSENLKPTLHTTFKSKGWYDYYLKTLLK